MRVPRCAQTAQLDKFAALIFRAAFYFPHHSAMDFHVRVVQRPRSKQRRLRTRELHLHDFPRFFVGHHEKPLLAV